MVGKKQVVGWNEYVDLSEWGVRRLGAKVDTGAATSALHVEQVELLPRNRIRFDVVVHRTKRDRHISVTTKIVRRSRVRSSNGDYEERYFVKTWMTLGPIEKEIEISLVDRGKMIHRMLLGRSALKGDYIVDVSKRHVLDKKKSRTKATKATKPSKAIKPKKRAKPSQASASSRPHSRQVP